MQATMNGRTTNYGRRPYSKKELMWKHVLTAIAGVILASSFAYLAMTLVSSLRDTTSEVTYEQVAVYEGDTLWDIANELNYNNLDVRKVLYEHTEILVNGEWVEYRDFNVADLQPGMVVRVAIHKNK